MRSALWVGLLLATVACGETRAPREPQQAAPQRVARTAGGAVVLAGDERIAVVTNRSAGVVSVFALDASRGIEQMIVNLTELDFGPGSEPWAAAIGADGDTAYVILRSSGEVVRIHSLHSSPTVDTTRVKVGSEPAAIAISPSGGKLFVSNWADGTVTMITTARFEASATIDLNPVLAETGDLGEFAVGRAGLAHPQALAISDDGDTSDDDEALYVTEFSRSRCATFRRIPNSGTSIATVRVSSIRSASKRVRYARPLRWGHSRRLASWMARGR